MGLRILLVLPIREGENIQIAPDMGLLYLGTVLRKQGHDVTLLDCPKEQMTFRGFRTFLESQSFDVVGFRCYSRDHNYVVQHLKIARQVLPQAVTLVGGPHPSALPEYVLRTMTNLDFAWKAEAEEGLPLLLPAIEQHGRDLPDATLRGVPGLVWRSIETGKIEVNTVSFGVDLDSYGIPAWDLLKPDTSPGFIWDECYPILTTRGCPYPCTYCNTPGLSGRKLRHRSVEHVVEELTHLKQTYGIKRFSIIDDEFTLDRKYAAKFCEGLIAAGLNLKWDCPVGVRLDSLTPELLEVMEKAGCESLAVGIESGSERVQKLIQKKVTVQRIREKAEMIAGCSGIKITGYFMIGFMDETEAEIKETIALARELPLRHANFNLVIPVPGTAIFEEALQAGRIDLERINWDTCTSDQIAFRRNHVTGKRLIQLQRQAYVKFYGRPKIVWQMIRASKTNGEVVWASVRRLKMLFRGTETVERTPMYLRESES